MAILLAFSSPRLLKAIRRGGAVDSPFMKTVAAFVHFILLQTVAICMALVAKSHSYDVVSLIGFFCLSYGTLAAVAVAFHLFNIAIVFNATGSLDDKEDDNTAGS